MSEPSVLIVCSDLFFSTQLRSAAEQSGWQPQVELSARSAAARASEQGVGAVVIDLELAGLDVQDFVASLVPAGRRPAIIAFGPHVQEQRLTAAEKAGCDRVLSRGQISGSLPQVLAELKRNL